MRLIGLNKAFINFNRYIGKKAVWTPIFNEVKNVRDRCPLLLHGSFSSWRMKDSE
jgi:hypothetical protein